MPRPKRALARGGLVRADGQALTSGHFCLSTGCSHSRRGFIAGVGALAAGAVLPVGGSLAQAPANPRRIDVHHHVFAPVWLQKKSKEIFGASDQNSSVMLDWSPARSLEQMDKNGIATTIPSVGNPGVWFGDVAEGRVLARECNEYLAQLTRDHPGRFGMFAALPLPDAEGSVKEIEYAFDTLKADGVGLFTSYGDKWPGDAAFAPVWQELNRRKAAVFFHPAAPNCCVSVQDGIGQTVAEFMFDITRSVMSLVFSGTVTRYPDIKFIYSHAGGSLPVLVERLEQQMRHKEIAERNPNGIGATIKNLYIEVANSTTSRPAMTALMDLMPVSHLMFGTDYPYVDSGKTAGGLDRFGLPAETLAAINRGNAARLFPRFA